jgi:hypothetical protein
LAEVKSFGGSGVPEPQPVPRVSKPAMPIAAHRDRLKGTSREEMAINTSPR